MAAAFLDRLTRVLTRFYGAAPSPPLSDLARMVDPPAFARVKGLLDSSVAAGARVVIGGVTDPAERQITPTVLADVTPEMPIMQEEIFGPVLPVLTYSDLDEVLRYLDSRPVPLTLYVFCQDHRRTEHILANTRSGGVVVNSTMIHLGNPDIPFGGMGESGIGAYHGYTGFLAFSHQRSIVSEGRFSLLSRFFPPYTTGVKRFAGLVRKMMNLG